MPVFSALLASQWVYDVRISLSVEVEAQPSLDDPHTLIFFVAMWVCLIIAAFPQFFFRRDRSWERRAYWSGVTSACVCVFFASLPYWKLGLGAALFGAGILTVIAYTYSPYLKIRGKIRALHVDDILSEQSPGCTDSSGEKDAQYALGSDVYIGPFGLTTAKKNWWLTVFFVAMCVLCLVVQENEKPWWIAAIAGSFLVIVPFGFGYLLDGSWGYSIARGQRVQFTIISVITLGAFAVLYLAGYYIGKRRPFRRKKSTGYRTYPHQWK